MIKGDIAGRGGRCEVRWLHTEKAQGSLGVLMYSIVIISTEFYRMDFSL